MIHKTTPVKPLVSRLTLWFALQPFLTPAVALPNQPSPGVLTDPPTVVALPAPAQKPVSTHHDALSQMANISSPESPVALETADSSATVPGLHDGGTSAVDGFPLIPAVTPRATTPQSAQRKGIRFGRRISTQNKLLGELDGLVVDYGLGNFAFNGIAGFPIGNEGDGINPSNQLFGFSAGVRKLPKGWDLGGYMMELRSADQNARSALGGAMRFSQNSRSLLISADYDLETHSLSRFMLSSAWKLLPASTLSTTLDIRQNHLPTPQNSYLQQTIALTEGWKWGLPFDRINDLSANAASGVTAFGFSLSHLLPRDIELNSDIAVLNISNDEDLNDLKTPFSEFNEYYFNLTLSGNGLLLPGDSNTVTLHSYISESSHLSSSIIDGSYALSHRWLVAPRLQIDYQDNLSDHSTQWVASPALKVEYRWRKQSMIHFTTTGEWRRHRDSTDEVSASSFVVSLGYQTDI